MLSTFLNLRFGLYLCSCGLVKRYQSQPKYSSNSKSASNQVQSKFPDLTCSARFIKSSLDGDLCGLGTGSYPRRHFAPTTGNGGRQN